MKQLAPHVWSDGADLVASLEAMPNLRTLLYVGPPDVISGAMAAAIQREFPFLRVSQSVSMQSALEEFDVPLRLVLVDLLHAQELGECANELLGQHPSAAIAIVTDSDLRGSVERFHQIDTSHVQGVLPLNVSLDVLLSMLRIILRGGTYFPSIAYRNQDGIRWRNEGDSSQDVTKPRVVREVQGKIMHQLTKRENQILGRIALGNQNKIIAAALGVSEHTVKIHIHNIITKLGVHNRTEAVALYFEHRDRDGDGSSSGYVQRPSSNPAPGGDA
ncbi:helix-turn-helix transcriptional regulator [Peteryoungia algae]|uniref:Response regulator transcription factor n=1 Tax=Peteryoungia algae TaxID=2919917 RepID=A0ABT0D581_9HYPH|nr:response regulator transcription factor [Rhizobium sp. SSM4.3]MCJ8240563.1 response regulator transcription factor [Rhizobium sp. SSM4.3]